MAFVSGVWGEGADLSAKDKLITQSLRRHNHCAAALSAGRTAMAARSGRHYFHDTSAQETAA